VEEADLVVPHPEAHRRGFVLAPLAELDPDFVHPITNLTVVKMLRRLRADRAVRKGGRIWT
jgi:7,8-dihydro-6-hydroxymethylpterin-pyrophosphokinase